MSLECREGQLLEIFRYSLTCERLERQLSLGALKAIDAFDTFDACGLSEIAPPHQRSNQASGHV